MFFFSKLSASSKSGPLTGIKVLDLTRILAGPTCTLILGDFGAEIIKIERPDGGDDTRRWPPFLKCPEFSATFVSLNLNKKSVCVNFKTTEGQTLLKQLVQQCDILVENYKPGSLCKYGLDYKTLSTIAPRLIYCSVSGFGPEGPYNEKPGVDLIAASMSGHLSITGPANGEPCRSGTSNIDLMTGLRAHGAILAALYQRSYTGLGCKIDTDLFSTAVAALKNYAVSFLNLDIEPQRQGTEHEYVVPYKSFKSKDGYLTLGAINDSQFKELCQLLKVPVLYVDKRFCTAANRSANRKKLIKILAPLFEKRTTKEWCDLFDKTNLPHGPLNTVKQVFEDPHLKAIDIVKNVTHPKVGAIKVLKSPVKFSHFSCKVQPAPILGQHTEVVLKTMLKYSDEKINELKSKGIIMC